MKRRPDINSSIEEIKSYQPKTMFGAWHWFYLKQELLRKKNSKLYRLKEKIRSETFKYLLYLFVSTMPLTLVILLKLDFVYEFLLLFIPGFVVGIFKSKLARNISLLFFSLIMIIAIILDPILAETLDSILGVNTVKTLLQSAVGNSIAIIGFFISYSVTRILIKLKKIEEYL